MASAPGPSQTFLDPRQLAEGQSDLSSEEQAVVDTVNRKVAAARSLDEVMDFLFDATREVCPCDRLGLAFVEEGGERIRAWYARTAYSPVYLKRGYAEDLSANTLAEIIESNRLRIISDLKEYVTARPKSASTRLLVTEGVRSSMTCPLSIDGRNVGVLFRSSRHPGAYDTHQARLHQAVAERLSQAVEKAWRIDQLTSANQAYFEMLSFVAHELKSPVASLVGDATVLAEGYLGEVSEKQRVKLENMIRRGNYLLSLAQEYLELARIEGGAFGMKAEQDVAVWGELVEPAVDIVRAQAHDKGMSIVCCRAEEEARAECDRNLVRIVLVNLLGNAIKYGNEGGQIRVRVEKEEAQLLVSVWNEGPGFELQDKTLLFRKFSRIRKPKVKRPRGTGVGLYNSWRIVKLHGGRIWANSDPGNWAEFAFEIPQPLPEVSSEGVANSARLLASREAEPVDEPEGPEGWAAGPPP